VNQHVFELTDAQVEAIKRYCNIDEICFVGEDKDRCVRWVDWREYDVRIYTFYADGEVWLDERDFDSDGWTTYNLDKEQPLEDD
jgi:hypothetical protein